MSAITFISMPTADARAYQAGALDANGQKPERHISNGTGVPCRHCQRDVATDEPYLILAYRPFPQAQPYAEIGPIFLMPRLVTAIRSPARCPRCSRSASVTC